MPEPAYAKKLWEFVLQDHYVAEANVLDLNFAFQKTTSEYNDETVLNKG